MAKKRNNSKKKGSAKNISTLSIINTALITISLVLCFFLIKQEYPDLFKREKSRITMPDEMKAKSEKKGKEILKNFEKIADNKKGQTDSSDSEKKIVRKETPTASAETKKSAKEPASATKTSTAKDSPAQMQNIEFDIRKYNELEIPKLLTNRASQIIKHKGYTASYNKDWKVSNWIAYELTAEETQGSVKRNNKFVEDPKVPAGQSATNKDYARSGFDRGHLAPAADMTWDETAMKESFYFSNMAPQEPTLNRGIWKKLEDSARGWAKRDSAICIITGPVVKNEKKKIGSGNVVVPTHFYKVILSPYAETPQGIGFIFKNEGSLKLLKEFAVSIDSVQKFTGIDCFHILPDSIQNKFEKQYDLKYWF